LHANYFLRGSRDRTQFQLAQQTSFVNRFDQSWPFVSVDFSRPADDLAAKAIRPLVQWMHRVWILQKATKETEIEICVAFTPSLASFPSVKLLLGVANGFLFFC
jgi:hypothetical protein